VVKRGARGATAFARDRMIFVSAAHPADIADPTGAGDAFAGGLVGGLASAPLDMEGALRQAAALGSLAVETFSVDRLLAVTAEGVEARGREVQIRVEPQGQV
jgi:sugar/nucleoside kinase (ribokinase family)